MKRPRIVTTSCPRCGRAVATLTRAIHGSEATRQKWAGLCDRCITPDEREELLAEITGDVARRFNRPPLQEGPR